MTQQLQQIIDAAWENRANISPAAAPKEVADAVEHVITELNAGKTPKTVHVKATKDDGSVVEFDAVVRIDTPGEADYYRNGGILQYVLRNMLKSG